MLMDALWPALDVIGALGALLLAIAVLELLVFLVFRFVLRSNFTVHAMMLTPALVGLAALVLFPLLFSLVLGFSNMSIYRFLNFDVGLNIFIDHVMSMFTEPFLRQEMFLSVLFRTLIWATVQLLINSTLGLMLAMALDQPIRGRSFFRALLILPCGSGCDYCPHLAGRVQLQLWRSQYDPDRHFWRWRCGAMDEFRRLEPGGDHHYEHVAFSALRHGDLPGSATGYR